MRAWLLLGGLVAGVVYLVYEMYSNRQQQYEERNHHQSSNYDDEEFVEINTTRPKVANASTKLPGENDDCCICLERLYDKSTSRRYCLVSLPGCGHWYHKKCALRLREYHPYCPVCRTPIDCSIFDSIPRD